MDDKHLIEVGYEIIHEMYMCAKPKLNFKKFSKDVNDKKIVCPKDWFLKHKITHENYELCIARATKKHKLTRRDMRRLAFMLLDYSPTVAD